MLAFELHHNGKRIARAGLRKGVLSAILSWVSRTGSVSPDQLGGTDIVPELDCRLGGLNTARPRHDEHVDWASPKEIRLGDELMIRVIRISRPDAPVRRSQSHVQKGRRRGVQVVGCSLCGKDRPQRRSSGGPGVVAGAQVVICIHCLGAAQLALENPKSPALHFALDEGTCSFCFRPRRARLLKSAKGSICDACVKTAVESV